MFFGNFADEVDNPVNNLNIYNVEGDNRLSPGVQPLKAGSVLKTRVFFQSGYNTQLSSEKQNIQI